MSSPESLRPHWFQILLSVADGAMHGSAIMEDVRDRTEGGVMLWPGTLYGSLAELLERGWIAETAAPADAPTEGGRRRFWTLTPEGRLELAAEARRLAAYVNVARDKRVLDEVEPA